MKKIGDLVKRYGVKNVVLRAINDVLPVNLIFPSQQLRRLNWQEKVKKKLKKYVVISDSIKSEEECDIIWWLWFQGLDNAPAIVKKCRESVDKYAKRSGKRVIELTSQNLFEYIEVPNELYMKYKSGSLPLALFSDFCRISLLSNYGGLWIDSTVLITGEIEDEILNQDIFMFQASPLDYSVTKISNWMLYSKYPGHPFISSIRDTLISFYNKNNTIPDYFLFHLLVSCLIDDNRINQSFYNMDYYTNTYPHLLGRVLSEPYDPLKFENILRKTSIHKLSYKNLDYIAEDSFYNAILGLDFS